MITFKYYSKVLLEFFNTVEGAVKHIDHLEENIINNGKQGVIEALDYINNAIQYFVSETDYKISTKADGSPAIVAGKDPKGNFFVASKSAFAKNPKINYSIDDIQINHSNSPGLVDKLTRAFNYLPSLNLKGIYQMDYMFDDEIKHIEHPETIDGVKNLNDFIAFQPNTIKYTVTPSSPYGKDIMNAKIGVAIHIEYEVVNGILKIKKYTSSPSEFSKSVDVFVFNVLFDKTANPNHRIMNMLLKDVNTKKSFILKSIEKVDFNFIKKYSMELKTYINTEIRQGTFLDSPEVSAQQFIDYIANRKSTELQKLKSDGGKQKKELEIKATLGELNKLKKSIKIIFEVTKMIATLKNSLVKVFNEMTKNSYLGTYFEASPGHWKSTTPEGYALSKTTNDVPNITKLVNRGEFSAQNFAQPR